MCSNCRKQRSSNKAAVEELSKDNYINEWNQKRLGKNNKEKKRAKSSVLWVIENEFKNYKMNVCKKTTKINENPLKKRWKYIYLVEDLHSTIFLITNFFCQTNQFWSIRRENRVRPIFSGAL